MKVNVRMMVPNNENNNDAFVGHYDLEIVQDNVPFRGRTIDNPVFSYRNISGGCLDVFPSEDSSLVYNTSNSNYKNTEIYKWEFDISDSDYIAFRTAIQADSVVASEKTHSKTSNGLRCTLNPDNAFSTYSIYRYNCFRAVATWLKWMGNNTLWNIYTDAHNDDYYDYCSALMVNKFSSYNSWSILTTV